MSYQNFTTTYVTLDGAVPTAFTSELVAVDVNLDGFADLVSASMFYPLQDSDVQIFGLINDQHGSFTLADSDSFGGAGDTHPRMIVTADFNKDGITDIFIADHGYDATPFPGHTNTLLLGKADGGYTDASSNLPSIPDFSHSAGAADIDGDGDVDIFVDNLNSPQSYFLINDGSAHFTKSTSRVPEIGGVPVSGTSTLFLNADKDHDQDLFIGTSGLSGSTAKSVLLLNDGKGNFKVSTGAMPNGAFGAHKTVVLDAKSLDFNGDGHADILATETSLNYVGAKLQVLISDGKGGFADHTSTYIHSQPGGDSWIIYSNLVDLNGDGAKDIVTEVKGADAETFYINDGRNHFYKTTEPLAQNGPIEALDVNKDGRMDLVTVNDNDGHHYIQVDLGVVPGAVMSGTTDADTMLGNSLNNHVAGDDGNDLLSGAAGNDSLDGGSGVDTLLGGSGNDTLIGGLGKDVLDGAAGHDTFRFSLAPSTASVDTITDFAHGTDHVALSKALFHGIGSKLDKSEFVSGHGAKAHDHTDHILYDTSNGHLLYDSDGSGHAKAIEFAVLSGHPSLSYGDFLMI